MVTSAPVKVYNPKRPVYYVWQYSGEDFIPSEVYDKITRARGAPRVIINQTVGDKNLEITTAVDNTVICAVGWHLIISPDESIWSSPVVPDYLEEA